MSSAKSRLAELRRLAREQDPREAVRQWTGYDLAYVAAMLGMSRPDLNLMLDPTSTRRYPHWQRVFEQRFDLEPYSLEPLIEEWKARGTTHAV